MINSERVEKNPALRTLAKLILNSFWGKFGEKTIRPKTELIYDYAELMRLVVDPTIKVNTVNRGNFGPKLQMFVLFRFSRVLSVIKPSDLRHSILSSVVNKNKTTYRLPSTAVDLLHKF